jgi:hypothetical protein
MDAKEFGKVFVASILIPVTVQVLSQLALAWQQQLLAESRVVDTNKLS